MAWAYVAIAGATALYSGYSASKTSQSNAEASNAAAQSNAAAAQATARTENSANNMIAMYNARSTISSAESNAAASQALADYNSSLLSAANIYSQELLADELRQIYENEDLDLVYLEQQRGVDTGTVVANQASSGTTIGDGSNQMVVDDLAAQYELQKTVLVHQYDRAAAEVLNAQAVSAWDTEVQIQKLQYETSVSNYVNIGNAYSQANSIMMSASVGSWANTQNANTAAQNYLQGGQAQYEAYSSQASQQMTAGVIDGIGAAAGTYANTYTATPATTSTTSSTSPTGRILPAVRTDYSSSSLLA